MVGYNGLLFTSRIADEVLVTWFCPRCIVGKLGKLRRPV
jgi:hypothetical protein